MSSAGCLGSKGPGVPSAVPTTGLVTGKFG